MNGDTAGSLGGVPALSTVATHSSSVGTYTISAAQGTITDTNYAYAFVPGTLSITPAVLTVTATSLSKIYGAVVPALTDSITGLVNGDGPSAYTGSASLSTTAVMGSPVGSYPISVTIGSRRQ